MSSSEPAGMEDAIVVESVFVRHRNVLLLRANFSVVFEDYFLNLMQHEMKNPRAVDEMMRGLLAGIVLHAVARPWAETHAWTVTLRAPRANLFVTADSRHQQVVGRPFLEDVKEPDRNLLYAKVVEPEKEQRRSTVELPGNEPGRWVEHYYKQSEQRTARFFETGGDDFALLAAQPDADEAWLAGLDADVVRSLGEAEELSPLEQRRFRFHCGCDLEKILPVLGSWRDRPEELFAGEEEIKIHCPRCGASYRITRGML